MKKTISISTIIFLFLNISLNAQNVWTQKTNFSGAPRYHSVAFAIGNKIYVGTGWNNTSYYNDFYEYDPASDTWTQKANFPGDALSSFVTVLPR